MFHVPWFLFGKIGKAKESGVMSAEGARIRKWHHRTSRCKRKAVRNCIEARLCNPTLAARGRQSTRDCFAGQKLKTMRITVHT